LVKLRIARLNGKIKKKNAAKIGPKIDELDLIFGSKVQNPTGDKTWIRWVRFNLTLCWQFRKQFMNADSMIALSLPFFLEGVDIQFNGYQA